MNMRLIPRAFYEKRSCSLRSYISRLSSRFLLMLKTQQDRFRGQLFGEIADHARSQTVILAVPSLYMLMALQVSPTVILARHPARPRAESGPSHRSAALPAPHLIQGKQSDNARLQTLE